jgi:hypothetical protein
MHKKKRKWKKNKQKKEKNLIIYKKIHKKGKQKTRNNWKKIFKPNETNRRTISTPKQQ